LPRFVDVNRASGEARGDRCGVTAVVFSDWRWVLPGNGAGRSARPKELPGAAAVPVGVAVHGQAVARPAGVLERRSSRHRSRDRRFSL